MGRKKSSPILKIWKNAVKETALSRWDQIILSSCARLSSSAAAAAKSLQSCLTLCDSIDGSPLGSSVPGILQARTLEWVAIFFSNAGKWKVKVKSCPTLSEPMDCSPPGSSVRGIFQARVLEWGAIAFSEIIIRWYENVTYVYIYSLLSFFNKLICCLILVILSMGFSGAPVVKNLSAMQETQVWSLSWEDPLEEGMATHSSILAWRILMDRGAWWATVHGVAQSWTWPKWLSSSSISSILWMW